MARRNSPQSATGAVGSGGGRNSARRLPLYSSAQTDGSRERGEGDERAERERPKRVSADRRAAAAAGTPRLDGDRHCPAHLPEFLWAPLRRGLLVSRARHGEAHGADRGGAGGSGVRPPRLPAQLECGPRARRGRCGPPGIAGRRRLPDGEWHAGVPDLLGQQPRAGLREYRAPDDRAADDPLHQPVERGHDAATARYQSRRAGPR